MKTTSKSETSAQVVVMEPEIPKRGASLKHDDFVKGWERKNLELEKSSESLKRKLSETSFKEDSKSYTRLRIQDFELHQVRPEAATALISVPLRPHNHKQAQDSIAFAQIIANHRYDLCHIPIRFMEGNLVYLKLHAGYKIPRIENKKLHQQRAGPFPFAKRVGNFAYKLDLPPNMQIAPVILVAMLEEFYLDDLDKANQKYIIDDGRREKIRSSMKRV